MPEQHGRLLADRYELRTRIGRGTMGTVWRAYDRSLDREIAVKEIRQDPALSPRQRQELRERLLREGRMAARVNHPSVATVHDVILADDSPWIIMELLDGRSLEQVIEEEGPLPPRLVAEIGYDLLGALRAAHAQNILHRDVKPANVLLTETGRVVLTDFGIAKALGDSGLTQTGMVIGSPGYTAPERARGDHTGPESDLWSLGATLYFAVEGRPAYERATVRDTLAALLTDKADPPAQAGPLRPVLEGLLEKDHTLRLRPERAAAMLRVIADTPAAASPPAAPAPPAPPQARPTGEAPSPGSPGDVRVAGVTAPGSTDDEDDGNRTMIVARPQGGVRPPAPPSGAGEVPRPHSGPHSGPASGPHSGPASGPRAYRVPEAYEGPGAPGSHGGATTAPPGDQPGDQPGDGSGATDRHSTTVPGRLPGRGPTTPPPPGLAGNAAAPPIPGHPAGAHPAGVHPAASGPDQDDAVPGSSSLGTDLFAMRGPAGPDSRTQIRVLATMGIVLAAILVLLLVGIVVFAR